MKNKTPSYFQRRLDDIYDIRKVFRKEGHEAAERSYHEIMCLLLLFINESLRSIRFFLSVLTGGFLGILFSLALTSLLKL